MAYYRPFDRLRKNGKFVSWVVIRLQRAVEVQDFGG
jgi:hypothetical protein